MPDAVPITMALASGINNGRDETAAATAMEARYCRMATSEIVGQRHLDEVVEGAQRIPQSNLNSGVRYWQRALPTWLDEADLCCSQPTFANRPNMFGVAHWVSRDAWRI